MTYVVIPLTLLRADAHYIIPLLSALAEHACPQIFMRRG